MTYRQWMWGHANGVTMCASGFWLAFTAERTAQQRRTSLVK